MTVDEVLETVAGAAPEVRAALPGRRQKTDVENPSGEQVLAADAYADELFEERLLEIDGVAAYASEEREGVVEADDGGEYHVAVDPLDGSSNLKSNNPMGTIVGVYAEPLPAAGRHLVAAAYVLYGPITTMVAAVEGEVTEYVIEDSAAQRAANASGEEPRPGDRRAVREDVTLPDDPTVYGFGGGVEDWPEDFTAYAEAVQRELKLRYGGAMVADVSQVVTYGGIFAYPGLVDRPEGKLRLLFEGNPIGYVVEAAGGASSNGTRSLLDVEPEGLHQRVPVHVGNEEYVERLEAALE